MKSLIMAASCAAVITLSASMVEAASLYDQYGSNGRLHDVEWVVELYYQQESEKASAFAAEEFRNTPQGKIIPLSFDHENSDPLGLFTTSPERGPDEFHKKWISLLFGVRTWNIEGENGFHSISVHSTSAIPLPAALPLFFGGLGALLLLIRLRKR
ncbi:MAG: hypothetical protein WD185_03365 [Sneathiella sp.]